MYDIENYYQAESVKDAVRLLNEPRMPGSFPEEVMY